MSHFQCYVIEGFQCSEANYVVGVIKAMQNGQHNLPQAVFRVLECVRSRVHYKV